MTHKVSSAALNKLVFRVCTNRLRDHFVLLVHASPCESKSFESYAAVRQAFDAAAAEEEGGSSMLAKEHEGYQVPKIYLNWNA